eukprot:EG_transcript_32833
MLFRNSRSTCINGRQREGSIREEERDSPPYREWGESEFEALRRQCPDSGWDRTSGAGDGRQGSEPPLNERAAATADTGGWWRVVACGGEEAEHRAGALEYETRHIEGNKGGYKHQAQQIHTAVAPKSYVSYPHGILDLGDLKCQPREGGGQRHTLRQYFNLHRQR